MIAVGSGVRGCAILEIVGALLQGIRQVRNFSVRRINDDALGRRDSFCGGMALDVDVRCAASLPDAAEIGRAIGEPGRGIVRGCVLAHGTW